MNENLYVLIATIDDRVSNLLHLLKEEQKNIFYVITHQITKPLSKNTKKIVTQIKNRKDVVYFNMNKKGISKSRNKSLSYVDDGIALVCDDDIIFYKDFAKNIKNSFLSNSKADVITFKTLKFSGEDYRLYPDKMITHNQKSITGVGSIEIAFRVDIIKKNNIKFDNDFGLGSAKYPVGEDYIFMADVLKKGLNAIFVPIAIVKHPDISTGLRFDREIIYGRGAVFARVFGFKSIFIDLFYSFKKYYLYKNKLSFLTYLYLMLKGSIDYLRGKR